jgi:hypothetical protein
VDDWDKVPSFDAGEAPRRSTSSLYGRLEVFQSFKSWIQRRRMDREASESAWREATVLGADGRTNFERLAVSELEALVGPIALARGSEQMPYLFGVIPGTDLTLYLYADEAQVHGGARKFLRERWDYRFPKDSIEDLVAFVRVSLPSNNRFERSRGASSESQGEVDD